MKIGILMLAFLSSLPVFAQKWYTSDVDKKVDELMSQMTVEEKLSFVRGEGWMTSTPIERLGIKPMQMSDGPQGLGTNGKSTAYPATALLAATWNEELAYRYGVSLGRDSKARGVNVLLAPAVNIYRAAMCGRNFEYMGEDPYLAGRMATGYVKGVQSQGVVATIKHFIGNNSDYDRHEISNDMDERTMHEIYLPAFKAVVQEGEVAALMTSYNLLNGVYTTETPMLLKDILRDKWGFKGMVMSDWGSLHYAIPAVRAGLDLEMASNHLNPKDLNYYLNTGLISMDMIDAMVKHILRVQVAFGFLNGAEPDKSIPLDDPASVETALEVAREGIVLLKNEGNMLPLSSKVKNIAVVGKNAHGYVCGDGSGKVSPFHYISIYDGLKNRAEQAGIHVEYLDELDFLPNIMFTDETATQKGVRAEYFANPDLKGSPVKVQTEQKVNYSWTDGGTHIEGMPKEKYSVRWSGVIVPDVTAEYEFLLGGDDGYRVIFENEVVVDDWKNGAYRTTKLVRTLEAGKKYPICLEYYQDGGGAGVCFVWTRKNEPNDRFVAALNKADMVVACIGHNSDSEGEGRDRSFELPEVDRKLMDRVAKSNTPVVAVVNAGGNVEMQHWEPKVKSLLWAWYAGQEGGQAIAEVLFGDVNPSGKLPQTFEKNWADNPVYDSYYDPDGDKHVEYMEGIFVGYRGYDKLKRDVQYPFGYGLSYTDFKLHDMKVSGQNPDGSVNVECTLTNTGKRDGAQVVQAYVGKESLVIARPVKELKGFKKVFLKVGESRTMTIVLPKDAFTYYSTVAKDFVTEPGEYNILLGFSSRDIKAKKQVLIK
ncbi:MAG: glycoside hydrolase family 3 C-terminal domain-containing protein [Bacteroidales bacterium]|nr:glycoside hydrolase family 3 C-terminal domain-containing protein [Bacteroidales bacterium]